MTRTLASMPPTPPAAGWVTYVRGHDDIGWAITEEDAAAVGESGHLHRRFLADFYAGDFPGSFARGARFQPEPGGESRTSGSAASLTGLQIALERGDEREAELAIRRVLVLHAVAFAHGGLPVIFMGDELGLLNDDAYLGDPAKADDNRWMHRPPMDWEAAGRRHDPASVEGRLWAGLQRLVAVRRATRAVHAQGTFEAFGTGNDHVLGIERTHAGDRLLLLASFSEDVQPLPVAVVTDRGLELAAAASAADGRELEVAGDVLYLAPYQVAWIRGT